MSTSKEVYELLDALAKVLLWCFAFGFLFLLLWFGAYLAAGDVIYNVHGRMFGLTKHELDTIHYCGMALVKGWIMLFFLAPYVAIRLALRKRPDQG